MYLILVGMGYNGAGWGLYPVIFNDLDVAIAELLMLRRVNRGTEYRMASLVTEHWEARLTPAQRLQIEASVGGGKCS